MAKNFLIITEGVKTEPNILEAILRKYGFNIIKQNPIKADNITAIMQYKIGWIFNVLYFMFICYTNSIKKKLSKK